MTGIVSAEVRITAALGGALVLSFIAAWLVSSGHLIHDLWRAGGMGPHISHPAEALRFLSQLFVHANPAHLLLNLLGLCYLGYFLERHNRAAFFTTFILTGCVSTLVYFGSANTIWVGCSGGVFGLAGYYVMTYDSLKQQTYSLTPIKPIVLIGVIVLSGVAQIISGSIWTVACHLAGFALGLLCALRIPNRILTKAVVFYAVLFATLMSLAVQSGYAWQWRQADADQLSMKLLQLQTTPPEIINRVSWQIASQPPGNHVQLVLLALDRQSQLLPLDNDRLSFADTFAALLEANQEPLRALETRLLVLQQRMSRRYARTVTQAMLRADMLSLEVEGARLEVLCGERDNLILNYHHQTGPTSWDINLAKMLKVLGMSISELRRQTSCDTLTI